MRGFHTNQTDGKECTWQTKSKKGIALVVHLKLFSYLNVVKSGMLDMVQKLHVEKATGNLLFGYNEDTIESLMLCSVNEALKVN